MEGNRFPGGRSEEGECPDHDQERRVDKEDDEKAGEEIEEECSGDERSCLGGGDL